MCHDRHHSFIHSPLYFRNWSVLSSTLQQIPLHFCTGFSLMSMKHPMFSWQASNILWINIAGFSLAAIADVLIAVSISCWLWMLRSGTKLSRNVIDWLISYSVETGSLTSVFAMVIIIAYVTMSNNLIWVGFLSVLPKCGFWYTPSHDSLTCCLIQYMPFHF